MTPAAIGLRTAWTNVRAALGAAISSIVLPETACRRGSFNFLGPGPIGVWFEPFSEATFLGRWGTQAAHQSCRVQTTDGLAAAGLYDEAVVTIDVWPDAFPNVVDASAGGRLPVAILSTSGFDATQIVPGSLRLASVSAGSLAGAANPGGTSTRTTDVNGDGRADLVVEFRLDRVPLDPDDIIIDVWGRTRGGAVFTGSDVVEFVQ